MKGLLFPPRRRTAKRGSHCSLGGDYHRVIVNVKGKVDYLDSTDALNARPLRDVTLTPSSMGWHAFLVLLDFGLMSTEKYTPGRAIGIGDVEHFHWKLSEADAPIVFSANGSTLSLSAAVELSCIQAYLNRSLNGSFASINVANCPVWSVLKRAHWVERRTRLCLRSTGLVVLVLPRRIDDQWWNDRLRVLLVELTQSGFPTRLARGLTGAVAEMVDNVWHHSETEKSGVLAYQVRRRKFRFSVADFGIGVLASLSKNPRYSWLRSSMDAIQQAIQPGVSSDDGGGMGFPSLFHSLADLWGSVRVRSGEAALLMDRSGDDRTHDHIYLPSLPGVHVSIRSALDPPPRTLLSS
jgi:anti-sigma regulatory factor (Ser/Thr protein kinase)